MIDKGSLHTNGRIALAKEGPLQDGNKLVGVLEDPIMQGGGSYLLASLGHTERRVVLGHTLNTLQHVITKIS